MVGVPEPIAPHAAAMDLAHGPTHQRSVSSVQAVNLMGCCFTLSGLVWSRSLYAPGALSHIVVRYLQTVGTVGDGRFTALKLDRTHDSIEDQEPQVRPGRAAQG